MWRFQGRGKPLSKPIFTNTERTMELHLIIIIIGAILLCIATFFVGRATKQDNRQEREHLQRTNEELKARSAGQESRIDALSQEITSLTSARDVQQHKAEALQRQLEETKENAKRELEMQATRMQTSFDRQLQQLKDESSNLVEQFKDMSKKQTDNQLALIKEQIQTTSEKVLKARETELGERNAEQVSKIIDPLNTSLKMMREALDSSKKEHQETITRLDATIQANMKNSQNLGLTAERLTRALTGEVKVQGNFGELKLRQLLEDLGLKEGEQYTTQATLKDRFGKRVKDDEEKSLIPDFILHFPNNRDVIIDSKVNLTAYERYINEENQEEKSFHCREHIDAVRRQVDNLARKDYSRYLSTDFTKLNFVIMYMHNEGALNLALLNDNSLWRYAYDKGVLIMGPQTMYMNLRVLELMWTQSRQLTNQQTIMEAAEEIIGRMQIFAKRFKEVDENLRKTTNCFEEIKKSTADGGQSVITSARKLIKAGVKEDKKKVSISSVFMQEETPPMIGELDDESAASQQLTQLPDNEDEALKHLFKK